MIKNILFGLAVVGILGLILAGMVEEYYSGELASCDTDTSCQCIDCLDSAATLQ